MPARTKPTKNKKPTFVYVNAYRVVRKAPRPGPDARVANHGEVLGSLQVPAGNARARRKAIALLHERYAHVVRGDGRIYKNPFAVALWVYPEDHPAVDWVDQRDEE